MRLFDVSTGHSVPSISDAMTEAVVSTSDAGRNAAAMELMATGMRVNILPNQPDVLRLTHVAEDAPPFYNERLAHDGFVTSMALSPDERLLVTGADDGQVYVWDAQTGLPLYTFAHARDGLVTYVAADFTPSGDHIISWDSNGEQRVWAIQPLTGDLFQTACRLLPFENGVRDVAGLIGDIATRDPCEDVVLLPRWGATMWMASR
jgi:WD40 repeat protein